MVRQPFKNWIPALLVGFAFLIGALPPLHEMDLAQHLAIGEWIAREHAVPFVEPFSWTREGQPFFAYSWLPQIAYFLLLDHFGPVALHLLVGAVVAGSVAAVLWAGRELGWTGTTRIAVALLHLALLWGVAPTLRPQQLLFVYIPLSWAVCARIEALGLNATRLAGLAGIAALAANTHLFFPLVAVPIGYFLLVTLQWRTWLIAAAVMAAGWLITPYSLIWHRVFELYFGHNVLLGWPPALAELMPGLQYALDRPAVLLVVLVLACAPWIVLHVLPARARAVYAIFWLLGLALFAYAGRLALAWWTLALPLVGLAVEQLHIAARKLAVQARRVAIIGTGAIVLIVSLPEVAPVFWFFEGNTVHRMLPRGGEDPALWLPSWLLCNTKPNASGRIFNEFNYGSELNWRLPSYTTSIDGRGMSPDSDAVEFTWSQHGQQRRHATTWTNADVALLNRSFWLAPILDAHPEWVLLAESRRNPRFGVAGLWAKRSWWQENGRPAELPAREIRAGDVRGTCEATGVFPRRW